MFNHLKFYLISSEVLKYWNEKLNLILLFNRWLPTFHSWPDIALTSGECRFAVLMVKGKKILKYSYKVKNSRVQSS